MLYFGKKQGKRQTWLGDVSWDAEWLGFIVGAGRKADRGMIRSQIVRRGRVLRGLMRLMDAARMLRCLRTAESGLCSAAGKR